MTTLTFHYVARTVRGARVEGTTHAATPLAAVRQLRAQGLCPEHVEPERRTRGWSGFRRIGKQDLASMTRQLAVLIGAKFPLSQALVELAAQESHPRLRSLLTGLASGVQAGSPLATCLEREITQVGSIYVESIRAAEHSGNLPKVLDQLATSLEQEHELRRQVRGALMYPACVVATLTIAVTFLLVFAVPKFAQMFAERGVALPWITRALMGLGLGLRHGWPIILPTVAAGAFVTAWKWNSPRFVQLREKVLRRIPGIAPIVAGHATARFARILGLCLGSGVGIVDSLTMAGSACGSHALGLRAREFAQAVQAGRSFQASVRACPELPNMAKRLLVAGEAGAELPAMCTAICKHFDADVQHRAKALATVIEPVMVVAIAGIVLLVALAVLLPLWDLTAVVS